MPKSRILVAVSSPWASDKFVGTVRDLAARLDGSVVVAHVAQPTESDATSEDVKSRAEQTLAALTDRLKEQNIQAESVLLFGDDVARAILNTARAQNATLIVMGISAKGRMARFLAGDVPLTIARTSEIPVLLFPPDWSGTV